MLEAAGCVRRSDGECMIVCEENKCMYCDCVSNACACVFVCSTFYALSCGLCTDVSCGQSAQQPPTSPFPRISLKFLRPTNLPPRHARIFQPNPSVPPLPMSFSHILKSLFFFLCRTNVLLCQHSGRGPISVVSVIYSPMTLR